MIIFNDILLTSRGWTTRDLGRQIIPTLSANTYQTSAMVGTKFQSRQIGEREFKITFHKLEATMEDLQERVRELVDILDVDEPKKLRFQDMPGVYINAMPTGTIEMDQTRSYGKISVSFKCFDPFFYANTPVITNLSGSGILKHKFKRCAWVIKLRPNTTMAKINVTIGNIKIDLNGNFDGRDLIEIDQETIKYNGNTAFHLLSLASRFGDLTFGDIPYTISDGVQCELQTTNKLLY